jgi:hypothetical protein
MADVEVKCPHCGFKAEWTKTGSSTGNFSYPKDIYPICPIITERLNRGEENGVKPLDCSRFRHEATRAMAAFRLSSL